MDYTPTDVMNKLLKVDSELEGYCDMLAEASDKLVDAEVEYDTQLSIELVRMKADGKPTTTAEKIAKGKPHIIATAIKVKGEKEKVKNLRQRIECWKSRLTVGQTLLKFMNDKIRYDNYTR